MAVAVDASSHATASAGATGNTGLTWSHTASVGATKLCVLFGLGISAGSVPNFQATYNGVSMTNQIQKFDGSFCGVQGFYLDITGDGSAHNIVVKNSGDVGVYQMAAIGISFTGSANGAPATGSNSNAGSSNGSVTVAGSANGDITIGAMMNDLGPTGTTTEGQTLIFEDENINSDTDYNAERTNATGTNTVLSWTHSSINWAAVGMSIAASGGGASVTYPQLERFSHRGAFRGMLH